MEFERLDEAGNLKDFVVSTVLIKVSFRSSCRYSNLSLDDTLFVDLSTNEDLNETGHQTGHCKGTKL